MVENAYGTALNSCMYMFVICHVIPHCWKHWIGQLDSLCCTFSEESVLIIPVLSGQGRLFYYILNSNLFLNPFLFKLSDMWKLETCTGYSVVTPDNKKVWNDDGIQLDDLITIWLLKLIYNLVRSIRIIVQSLSQCGTSVSRNHIYACLSVYLHTNSVVLPKPIRCCTTILGASRCKLFTLHRACRARFLCRSMHKCLGHALLPRTCHVDWGEVLENMRPTRPTGWVQALLSLLLD